MRPEDIVSRILTMKHAYVEQGGQTPRAVRFTQNAFNVTYDYMMKDVEGVEIDKSKDRPLDDNATIFGMKIKIDNSIPYGDWRFEW